MGVQVRDDGRSVKGLPGYSSMAARFAALVEESFVRGACECGEFVFEGSLCAERAAFRVHVELCHPERLAALNVRRRSQPVATPKPAALDYELLLRLDGIAARAAA